MNKHKHAAQIKAWADGKLIACSSDEGKTWHVQATPEWLDSCKYKVLSQQDIVPMLKQKSLWLKYNLHTGHIPREGVIREIGLLLERL